MKIQPEDIKIEVELPKKTGMHVGMLVGVRVIHIPTGTEAFCKLHRSQHKNRDTALEMIEWALST